MVSNQCGRLVSILNIKALVGITGVKSRGYVNSLLPEGKRKNMNSWYWKVGTPQGDFSITVIGNWTQAEASKKLRAMLFDLNLDIISMIPTKRATGPQDARGTIYEQEKPDTRGFDFLASKKIWEVTGRGIEYQAEMVRMDKQKKDEGS